ncbi:dephospho-CoA kinase [Thermanaerosceptrum fracticalcis]|uniref:Dephospho-CoA kinase n=1 Tax=Thermanaerosceptrum fracticalcis TaxID=1712410 RepID=A0A7G6DYG5_THEFR|nr:dephospho-CoA kinase [Thermanaerosceptrum fracticalcis]QNB44869.1 dephospho-CoA kinase [Thermanaerosceptrum fracticalcis]
MLVIGLTGGIASGKSTVSRYLRERGAVIIDADALAKELVARGTPAWQEIVAFFGSQVLDEAGNIDRKRLGQIIFVDPQARTKLNSIVHPKVIEATKKRIRELKDNDNVPLIVVDAPLLIEAGMTDLVDEVWVVAVPVQEQLNRLMFRDKLSQEEAIKRIHSQMPLEEKLTYADRIIDNSGSVEETLEILDALWKEIVHDTEK